MTGLLSIPPVYFVVPIIFAVNVVSEIRNVSETCSSAPVSRVQGRTQKQSPGSSLGSLECHLGSLHGLGVQPSSSAPADALSHPALAQALSLHSSHRCARKVSATALDGS